MATMIKEKRREKKKPKEKHPAKSDFEDDHVALAKENVSEFNTYSSTVEQIAAETTSQTLPQSIHEKTSLEQSPEASQNITQCVTTNLTNSVTGSTAKDLNTTEQNSSISKQEISPTNTQTHDTQSPLTLPHIEVQQTSDNAYEELNSTLDRLAVASLDPNVDSSQLEVRLQSPHAYLQQTKESNTENTTQTQENIAPILADQNLLQNMKENSLVKEGELAENVTPSAPVFEEEITKCHQREHITPSMKIETQKPRYMSLEEAVRLFGGREMEEIRVMGEREEALVEAGPFSGPEHPLVDLLSTFRTSLKALDRERMQLINGFIEEEKFRNSLWKIQKRQFCVSEKCPCNANVWLKGVYEHAELQQERLPVARLRLERLVRTVQDCYCHHQHSALLAYSQIEQLISETTQSSKIEIREALALVFEALRAAASGPEALCAALQRWAAALATALVDQRDYRQLVYLIHHLFRQTRSVRWAAKAISFNVTDMSSAARAVAILDLMLNKTRLEAAAECTEEEEVWEELDETGCSSAVSDGSVRERDLVAMVRASPLRALVARLSMLSHADITLARPQDWSVSGPAMVRSVSGARALLAVCGRAVLAHSHYRRLRRLLSRLAVHTLHCLANLHLHCRSTYSEEFRDKISAELEACFAAGVCLLEPKEVFTLPASLLSDDAAKDYCTALMVGLHDSSPKPLPSLAIQLPAVPCAVGVRMVAQAAMDRTQDHQLATMVMEFLAQIGIKRSPSPCKAGCGSMARDKFPRLLAAHPYLHTMALHILADLYQAPERSAVLQNVWALILAEALDPSALEPLSASRWRPSSGEVRAVLDDWAQRCKPLLQHLLLALDYTPHTGVSLESQLSIGSWLCDHSQGDPPEWAWLVLRHLHVHRAAWGMPLDAAPPDGEPQNLFGRAYAVLATSWGHSVPLICSSGVSSLCRLAAARPREAVHCLAQVMRAMAQSPESLSYTPQFEELLATLLRSGPSVVQRALGLGPPSGPDLLLRAILQQLEGPSYPQTSQSQLVSAWLHALWRVSLSHCPAVLETVLLASRHWTLLDGHIALMLQQPSAKDNISSAVRSASTAPLLCEAILRTAHAHYEAHTNLSARLLDALHRQRLAGERIHVDNALKQIGAPITSEELVIHRTATALLTAPLSHPAHLTLWRLLLHLYLQRPPNTIHESTPPVGPLFFSGLIKSRVFTQLRARLTETAKYHHGQMETLKSSQRDGSQPQMSPSTSSQIKAEKSQPDDDILPVLQIEDLTGDSSDSSDLESSSEDESEGDNEIIEVDEGTSKTDVHLMISYHAAAEKMVCEFARWLDEGDKTRAMPYHADIARFIPESALTAAWNSALSPRRPPAAPPPSPRRGPAPAVSSPFESTVRRLMRIKDRSLRTQKPTIEPGTDDIDFRNYRQVLKKVDQHLSEIERLSLEWSSEVGRVATLNTQLWGMVAALRVERPLPPVRKSCTNGCKALTIIVPAKEWCISPGAAHGVSENRAAARAALRRLARPRPAAAHTAARLQRIAGHVSSVELARAIAERAWRCAAKAEGCAPAEAAITALVHTVADRWLCHDGRVCAELVSRWSPSSSPCRFQQSLVAAVVQPSALPPREWPVLYGALLTAHLPSIAVFSHLSKFEVSRWSQSLEASERRQLLEGLLSVAQRWGPTPGEEHQVLFELIGVHTTCLIDAAELPAHALRCTRAAISMTLPSSHWPHIVAAADACAKHVPFDQLGNLLRSLGASWWSARAALAAPRPQYWPHGPHVAALLHRLAAAFAAAAVSLSYAPERVSWYTWSALQESWGPWVCPHGAALPLLPSTADDQPEEYTTVVQLFVRCLKQIMTDCPGTEEYLLQHTFEWAIQTHMGVNAVNCTQEARVQLSTLLGELAALPWTEYQWANHKCLQAAAQICSSGDKEILTWCSATWRSMRAQSWLKGIEDGQIESVLATTLYVFTTSSQHPQTLSEAALLPWRYLSSESLTAALERYFTIHHSPALPYHEQPHFSLVLTAAELTPCEPSPGGRLKRGLLVSLWTRAALSPPLHSHVSSYCTRILTVLTHIAPHIEYSEGEIEELLNRAMITMNIEPAAASALPEWQRWTRGAPYRLLLATLTAAGQLTTLPYFGAIADHTIKAYLKSTDSCGWSEVVSRWRTCHWRDAAPLLSRSHLCAAYGVVATHAHSPDQWRAVFKAVMAAGVNFIENEAIVAVWICVACRIGCGCSESEAGAECREAARALLRRWGEEPRRSLLRVVALTDDSAAPTAIHRLLSRLAVCVLSSASDAVRAYEAACTAVLGSSPGDVLHWGKQPHPKRVVRLAMRLLPNCDTYFKDELELVPDDS